METITKDGKILKVKSRFHQESQLQKFFQKLGRRLTQQQDVTCILSNHLIMR